MNLFISNSFKQAKHFGNTTYTRRQQIQIVKVINAERKHIWIYKFCSVETIKSIRDTTTYLISTNDIKKKKMIILSLLL